MICLVSVIISHIQLNISNLLTLSLFVATGMIFVRTYESRMDLLRAVIIGADGTPYHDGLFFFDIFFPDTYPSVPPVSLFELFQKCVFVVS